MAKILEAQPGNSLNEKFENLVQTCYIELDAKKAELARIDKSIQDQYSKLMNLQRTTREFVELEQSIASARKQLGAIEAKAKALAEKKL